MRAVDMQDEVHGLMDYINKAPTPYHSTDYISAMLDDAGAVRLKEGDAWGDILPGMIYYFVHNDSSIAAFRLGDETPSRSGWRIAAAHHDSPGFRIKPCGSTNIKTYERLCLEPYGGVVRHTWVDRPLALAGRIYTKSGYSDGVTGININIGKPLLVIPGLAIHADPNVNDSVAFNVQTEMLPFVAQDVDGERTFLSMIAAEAAVDEDDILSYELMPYDAMPACLVGASGEFISAPRLDDYTMAYSVIRGFIESADSGSANAIALIFNHEECGSQTDRGASSNMAETLLARIADRLGYDFEDQCRSYAKTMLFSADMAHATHPAYPSSEEPNHIVYLNKGPVLKISANQSYASSPSGEAYFKKLCEEHAVPYQVYVNRGDKRSGSTIGPMLSSRLGITAVDVGNAMLSMHSVREMAGAIDVGYAKELFEAYYTV